MEARIDSIQDIIGTDAGDRGMKSLIVPGDLFKASETLGSLKPGSRVIILSGFPCCIDYDPPTETDGPPGAMALARACIALQYSVTLITDQCNLAVFSASIPDDMPRGENGGSLSILAFSSQFTSEEEVYLKELAAGCQVLLACERAGPGPDGQCYTMRGINMTAKGLIAPLHRLVEWCRPQAPFLAIGDGGNELGMGKVLDKIVNNPKIALGDKIGCVVAADHLIAASVSNWGGYALAVGAALIRAQIDATFESQSGNREQILQSSVQDWIAKCLPTEQDEINLLRRCVDAGCRDGVSGQREMTVDGMPLETSLECLRAIRDAALSYW